MSPPTKQEEDAARSPEPLDWLADDAHVGSTAGIPERPGEPPWQFLQQGYDWTGGSLRTKGYRTDFNAIQEREALVRTPVLASAPKPRDPSPEAQRSDWRHPDYLDVVTEFVSSLPASTPKTLQTPRRSSWLLAGAGLAALCVLGLVGSFLFIDANDSAIPQPQAMSTQTAQSQTAAALSTPPPAAPAEPTPTSLPALPDTTSASPHSAPVVGPVIEVLVNSERESLPPVAALNTRIELETREVSVSGRAVAAVIVLKRTGSTKGSARVRWKTVPGSATPTEDYQSTSGVVKFTDGQAMRTVFVPILQPTSRNEPRSFSVSLQRLRHGPALGTIQSATVTIGGDS